MRAFVSTLLALAILCVCSPVAAQTYTRYRLPLGTRLTVSGEIYQAFLINEYAELLHMDEDLRFLTEAHENDQLRLNELNTAHTELTTAFRLSEEQLEILTTERTRLNAALAEERRLRIEAENRPDWNWIPWSLSAGLAISTLVLAVIVGVR